MAMYTQLRSLVKALLRRDDDSHAPHSASKDTAPHPSATKNCRQRAIFRNLPESRLGGSRGKGSSRCHNGSKAESGLHLAGLPLIV